MTIGIIIIVVAVILDQITKYIASVYFTKQVYVIENFFSFKYHENTGGGWSILEGQLWVFIIVGIIALGVFAYMMKDFNLKTNSIYSIALILMIAGNIGNLLDRIFRGFVIDFLKFDFGNYTFPIFNLADSFLTIGIILLIFDVLFGKTGQTLK